MQEGMSSNPTDIELATSPSRIHLTLNNVRTVTSMLAVMMLYHMFS